MSISIIHILPEVAEDFTEWIEERHTDESMATLIGNTARAVLYQLGHDDEDAPFPLPYVLLFSGYTLILLIDKVIFNTHALTDPHHGAQSSTFVQIREKKKKGEVLSEDEIDEGV